MAKEIIHGQVTTYQYRGCRCEQCRHAMRVKALARYHERVARGVCVECKEPATVGARCKKHSLMSATRSRNKRAREAQRF